MISPPHDRFALFEGVPGQEILRDGLADLAAGRETVATLLLEIAASRLRQGGVALPPFPAAEVEAEIRLIRLLGGTHGREAHSQYNAWLRRLARLCSALDRRAWAGYRQAGPGR